MRRFLGLLLALAACHTPPAAAPAAPVWPRFSGREPAPDAADLLMGCAAPASDGELGRRVALLSIILPWEEDRPVEMFELAQALSRIPAESCQDAALQLYIEVALAYPAFGGALYSFAAGGAISARRAARSVLIERSLAQEKNANELLIRAALLLPSEDAVRFLTLYGGADPTGLINAYQIRSTTAPPPSVRPDPLQRPK